MQALNSAQASVAVDGAVAANDKIVAMKVQPMRALRAFRKLLANKEDTAQVFEIMQAMNGQSTARSYQRLISTVKGGRIAYDRQELAPHLSRQDVVDGFADGTVGAAYRRFIQTENLSADGLAEESRRARGGVADAAHPLAWFGRRIRDTHDIWHTLTGYGRDGLGELCLVAFSYAQTGSLGWAFIAIGGSLQGFRAGQGALVAKAVWEAYRRGRAAAWLPGEDITALLNEPLDAARRRLNIPRPSVYEAAPEALRRETMAAAPTSPALVRAAAA